MNAGTCHPTFPGHVVVGPEKPPNHEYESVTIAGVNLTALIKRLDKLEAEFEKTASRVDAIWEYINVAKEAKQ